MIFRFAIAFHNNETQSADLDFIEPGACTDGVAGDEMPIAIRVNRFVPAAFVFRCKAVRCAAVHEPGAKSIGS